MISFVYFDVGGVVLHDFSGTDKWEELKKDIGVSGNNRDSFNTIWKQHRQRICVDCDIDTLIPIFEQKCHIHFPKEYSLLADFVNRFEKNPSIWPVIQEIQKKCRVGLLTNQYPRMFDAVVKRGLVPPIQWDSIIDSSVVKLQKPDPKIYEFAQKKAQVKHEEILFVDNSIEHIEAAKKIGWKTFLYDSTDAKRSNRALHEYFATIA